MSDHVIETTALTKRYGDVVAVNELTLRVPRGGVFGFLGPNGSGKTTTMGMLLGLVHATSGEAHIFGDSAFHPATLRRVGAMVETPTFYPYLSGRANLRYFQAIGKRGSPADIDRLLKLVDLGKRADSKFATYSLGMKQRLGVALALLGNPELVFLDEPTNGLDPAGVVEVRELIRELGTDGRTVVLSSHLLAETELVCDNVAVLSRGKLIAQGTIKELLREHDALRLRTTDNTVASTVLGNASVDRERRPAGRHAVGRCAAGSGLGGRARARRSSDLRERAHAGAPHARGVLHGDHRDRPDHRQGEIMIANIGNLADLGVVQAPAPVDGLDPAHLRAPVCAARRVGSVLLVQRRQRDRRRAHGAGGAAAAGRPHPAHGPLQ